MRVTVIYAHPWDGSFNQALLQTTCSAVQLAGHKLEVIDLYKDDFNPVMSAAELAHYRTGQPLDEKVALYQRLFEQTDALIFIFPVWWGTMPAILKGFLDKMLLPGWAYDYLPSGILRGRLRHIKKALIINTMGGPRFYHNLVLRFPLKRVLAQTTLRVCGVGKVRFLQFGRLKQSTPAKRKAWLEKTTRVVSNFTRE